MFASSSSSSSSVNFSNYYFRAGVPSSNSQICAIVLVPLEMVPSQLQQLAMQQGLQQEDIVIRSHSKMLKRLKSASQLVASDVPVWIADENWKIYGLKKTPKGITRVFDCSKDYASLLKNKLNLQDELSGYKRGSDVDTSSKTPKASPQLFSLIPPSSASCFEVDTKTAMKVLNQESRYLNAIAKLVDQYGPLLCPTEPLETLWASLFLSVVCHHPGPMPQEERMQLLCRLLNDWQNVQWDLYRFLQLGRTQKTPEEVLEVLTSLRAKIYAVNEQMQIDDIHLLSKLEKILDPLKQIVDYALALPFTGPEFGQSKAWKEVQYLCVQFLLIHQSILHQVKAGSLKNRADLPIEICSKPEALKSWIRFRAAALHFWLSARSQSHERMLSQIFYETEKLIRDRQWIDLYHLLVSQEMSIHAVPAQEMVDQKQYDRYYSSAFFNAFAADLKFYIAQGKLFSFISQEANTEMMEVYGQIRVCHKLAIDPAQKSVQASFQFWINHLARFEGFQLQKELDDFHTSLKVLLQIKKRIKQDEELFDALSKLQAQIKDENNETLLASHAWMQNRLQESISCWEENLKKISILVENIQATCVALLYHPEAPVIDLKILKEGFSLLNRRLLNITRLVTQFFNCFQQLICGQGVLTASSSSQPSFKRENDFVVSLFTEDEAFFKELQEEFEVLMPKPDLPMVAEGTAATSVSARTYSISSEILDTVKEIFAMTKTEKIVKEMKGLLARQGISYHIVPGKGDHFKLYLSFHAIPIILPAHVEWKAGTKHSIENELLFDLQSILAKDSAR